MKDLVLNVADVKLLILRHAKLLAFNVVVVKLLILKGLVLNVDDVKLLIFKHAKPLAITVADVRLLILRKVKLLVLNMADV